MPRQERSLVSWRNEFTVFEGLFQPMHLLVIFGIALLAFKRVFAICFPANDALIREMSDLQGLAAEIQPLPLHQACRLARRRPLLQYYGRPPQLRVEVPALDPPRCS